MAIPAADQSFTRAGESPGSFAIQTSLAQGQKGNEKVQGWGIHIVVIAITNVIQTMVGVGMLALPAALRDGGVGIGTLNLAVMGCLSLLGFLTIGRVCYVTGARTYREAWKQTIGRGEKVVDLAIFLETSITMIGYSMIITDYIEVILDSVLGWSIPRCAIALILTIFVIIPLGLQPQLHNLRFSSRLGNCAIMYMVCFVILNTNGIQHVRDATFLSSDANGIFRATSVMASAYIAHYNAPYILSDLLPHPRPWQAFFFTVMVAFAVGVIVFETVALSGYARWGPEVMGNLLLNYGRSSTIMVAWCSMTVTTIASFAMHVKPARDGCAQTLGVQLYRGHMQEEVVKLPFLTVTLSVLTGVVVVSIACRNLSYILAFRGALLGSPISMAFPGLMLLNCPNTNAIYRRVCGCLLVFAGLANSCLGFYCALS